MTSPHGSSAPLARFAPEVGAAFERFQAAGDRAALLLVVTAIVESFVPTPRDGGPVPVVTPEKALVADLGFDSIAIAEAVFLFEDLFGVSIGNKDLAGLRTVRDLCEYVERRAGALRASS